MDRARFDAIAKLLATTGSRRAALGALISAGLLGRGPDDLEAKKKGKGHGKGRGGDGNAQVEDAAAEVQAEAVPESDELSGPVHAEAAAKKRRGGKGKGRGKGKGKGRDKGKNQQPADGSGQAAAESTTCCGTKSCAPPAYVSDRRNCNYEGQTFTNLRAEGTNAYKINGKRMTVSGGNWRRVNFEGACLQGAKFTNNVDLRSVNFKDACLVDADLTGAQVDSSVNFYDAILCRTKLPPGVPWGPDRDCNRGTACCATCDERNACPTGQKCCNGRCVTGVCCSAADCPNQQCKSKTCTSSNQCRYTNQPDGQPGTDCTTQCCKGICCTGSAQCVSGTCQTCNAQTCANGCCASGQCFTAPNDQNCGFNAGACTNCTASGKVCNAQGQCVCPANKPNLCEDGTCQECCTSGQCPNANAPICGANRTCVACTDGPLNSQQCSNAGKGNLCCGGQCAMGVCCEDGQCQTTGNDCVTNQCKCGSGPICTAPTPVCCGSPPEGVCVNTQTDPDNCGRCGETCDPGQTCSGGQCVCTAQSCQSGCCNAQGQCVTPQPNNQACGLDGATCIDCASSGEICNEAGDCVECLSPDTCPAPPNPDCQNKTCVSGECGFSNKENGTICELPGPGGVCKAGTCVECLQTSDCGEPADPCKQYVCNTTTNICELQNRPDFTTTCPSGLCCGGICRADAECCANAQCPAAEPVCNQTTFQCDCTTSPDSCPADSALICKARQCVNGNCATVNTQNGQPGPNCTGPQQQCQDGSCICVPKTCADFQGQCGSISDGCSQTLNCTCSSGCCDTASKTCKVGTSDPFCGRNGENCTDCVEPLTCGGGGTPGVCGCTPNCTGKVCGPDGCGGSCGPCPTGTECNGSGRCICTAASCPDGCCSNGPDNEGICRTSSITSCGTGGVACVTCPTPSICNTATCSDGVCGTAKINNAPDPGRCDGANVCCNGICVQTQAGRCPVCCQSGPQCPAGIQCRGSGACRVNGVEVCVETNKCCTNVVS